MGYYFNPSKTYYKIMSLATEIKQIKPFSSEKEKALVNLMYTHNLVFFKLNHAIKKFDISNQQYNVLRILNGQNGNPITVQEIITRMLDKMSNASRLVDKLYAKGYVNKVVRPFNKRACDVTITAEGVEILKMLDKNVELVPVANELSSEEFETLNFLLDKIRLS